MRELAMLGGQPRFPDGLPFARPPAPPLGGVVARLAPSYLQGALTNGPLVRELEAEVADRLGVRHVVAVASCTTGLMLAIRALASEGSVVLPSFTFSASAHALAWNGLRPVFCECDERSFQIELADAEARIDDDCAAVLATHVFGAPCDAEGVEALAARNGMAVVFDAAHGLGSMRGGRPIGTFGDAEVFSLSPTKPVTAGEGGLVATSRDDVAEAVRLGRDYGNPGDYDTRFVGLNARMSELHAAVALESLDDLDEHLEARHALALRYASALASVPGITVQRVPASDRPTWKDFTIAVHADVFGVSRDGLVAALRAEGVDTRCYFDPPVHRQRSHAGDVTRALPVTDEVAARVVSLPLYRDLGLHDVDRIASVLADVHEQGSAVAAAGVG
jgi:dTDP-4-amino-4,6-dideoxygalactose transaminase